SRGTGAVAVYVFGMASERPSTPTVSVTTIAAISRRELRSAFRYRRTSTGCSGGGSSARSWVALSAICRFSIMDRTSFVAPRRGGSARRSRRTAADERSGKMRRRRERPKHVEVAGLRNDEFAQAERRLGAVDQ